MKLLMVLVGLLLIAGCGALGNNVTSACAGYSEGDNLVEGITVFDAARDAGVSKLDALGIAYEGCGEEPLYLQEDCMRCVVAIINYVYP